VHKPVWGKDRIWEKLKTPGEEQGDQGQGKKMTQKRKGDLKPDR